MFIARKKIITITRYAKQNSNHIKISTEIHPPSPNLVLNHLNWHFLGHLTGTYDGDSDADDVHDAARHHHLGGAHARRRVDDGVRRRSDRQHKGEAARD